MTRPAPKAEFKPRTVATPVIRREAAVVPSTFNEDDLSVEVMMSTGAAVLRFDWWDGEYYDETLGLEAGEVRLDRINEYAPALDCHDSYSLASVIGSVVPGSVRVESGQMLGRISLSNTPDVADIVAKIRAGHIKKVSIGYQVYAFELREPGDNNARNEMRAVDWEPIEVSFVPLPAEFAAGVRSEPLSGARTRGQNAQQGGHPCVIRGVAAAPEETIMDVQTPPAPAPEPTPTPTPAPTPAPAPTPTPTPTPPPTDGDRSLLVTAAQIRERAAAMGSDFIIELLARHADTAMTKAQLDAALVDQFVAQRAVKPIDSAITIAVDEKDKYRAALSGAFLVRMTGSSDKPKDGGEVFGHMTTREIARDYLVRSGIRDHARMGPMELFQAALGMQRHGAQTSSDFAIALQQSGNLAVLDAYENVEEGNWQLLSKETDFADFRPHNEAGLTGTPEFLVVQENGEYTYASFQDIGASSQLWTSGRIISLSRQLLVNDQLGLFGDMAGHLGRGAALHEANSWWAFLLGNVTLADSIAMFHASHGNLAGSGSAPTVATLGAGRAAMRNQKDRDGVTPLYIVPKYLVFGPALETAVDQLLTTIQATQIGNTVPTFVRSLTPVVEPRITDYAWYLLADPNKAGAMKHGYLRGQKGIFTDSRVGFEVDGVEYKGRLDFNARAADYRGAYKNPGAAPS